MARQQRLADSGIVPRKDVEAAKAEVAKARADAMAARRAEQLSTIRSPITGVVTRMSATLGASVDPSQSLVEISDPLALDVLLERHADRRGARAAGAKRVTLSAGQAAGGEPLGIGSVADVAGTVDSTTRSVAVRVRAPTTRRPLRIGETVFGVDRRRSRALTRSSFRSRRSWCRRAMTFKVFVVDATGIAHEREVKVGWRNATRRRDPRGPEGRRADRHVRRVRRCEDSAKVVPLDAQ